MVATKVDLAAKLQGRLGFIGGNRVAGDGNDGNEQGPGTVIDRYDLPTPGGAGSPGLLTPLTAVQGFGTSLGPGGGGSSGIKDHGFGLIVVAEGDLADGETLTLTGRVEQADDLAFSVNVETLEPRATRDDITTVAGLVINAPSGGGAVHGAMVGRYDTQGARRFLRAFFTATFSAGATDEADITQILAFYGADDNPFREDGAF